MIYNYAKNNTKGFYIYVCENCFNSDVINEHITKVGYKLRAKFKCKECGEISTYRIDKDKLADDIHSAITRHFSNDDQHGLYTSASMMAKEEDDDVSDILSTYSLREIYYELFKMDDDVRFFDLIENHSSYDSLFSGNVDDEGWMNIGRDWDGSSIIELKWDEFCENVKHKARFFEHSQFNRSKELSKLNATFLTLSTNVSTTLYRARNANKDETLEKIHLSPAVELGIAPPQIAGYNRFSSKSI